MATNDCIVTVGGETGDQPLRGMVVLVAEDNPVLQVKFLEHVLFDNFRAQSAFWVHLIGTLTQNCRRTGVLYPALP